MYLNFSVESILTEYWSPGTHYLELIVKAIKGKVVDGDFVVISEKAISIAKSQLIDERLVKPSLFAKILAKIWVRFFWGYFLGSICHLKTENINRFRQYPLKEGSVHKQVALWHVNLLQALLWGSEGGIDGTNLPYSYVSLPLNNPQETAEEIRKFISDRLGIKTTIMIVDTDKTYSFRNFHFTPRPNPLNGIHDFLGVIAYIVGRFFRLKRRSTPLAISGVDMPIDFALDLAEYANKQRGSGAGLTVWDMAKSFNVGLTEVTWYMLRRIEHKPLVIIRYESSSRIRK